MRPADEKMNNWTDFDGHYEKHECDVMLKDGTIVEYCWPNGGSFVQVENTKTIINVADVAKIRYHDYFSKLKKDNNN